MDIGFNIRKDYVAFILIGLLAFSIPQCDKARKKYLLQKGEFHGTCRDVGGIYEEELKGAFNPRRYINSGCSVIFDFCTDKNPECIMLHRQYKKFLKKRPDVIIVKYPLPPRWRREKVALRYDLNLEKSPSLIIYGIDQQLLATDNGQRTGLKYFLEWYDQEVNGKEKK